MKKLPNFGSVVTFAVVLACTFFSQLGRAGEGRSWTFKDPDNKKLSWNIEQDDAGQVRRLLLIEEDGTSSEIRIKTEFAGIAATYIRLLDGQQKGLPTRIVLHHHLEFQRLDHPKNSLGARLTYTSNEETWLNADDVRVTDLKAKPASPAGDTWTFSDFHHPEMKWQVEEPTGYSGNGVPMGPLKLILFTDGFKQTVEVEQDFKFFRGTSGTIVPVRLKGQSPLKPTEFSLYTSNDKKYRAVILHYKGLEDKTVTDLTWKGSGTKTAALTPKAPTVHPLPKDIRRWQIEIPRGVRYSPILVGFSIYQPDGDSVLMEYANKQTYTTEKGNDHNLGMRAVDHFQIVETKNPKTKKKERAFKIEFKAESSVLTEKTRGDISFVLQPVSILAFQDGTVVIENQEGDGVVKRSFKANVKDFDVKSFEVFPWYLERQVQEPGTIHPVPYKDYFGPRDITFKTPDRALEWGGAERWSEVWAARPSRRAPSTYYPPAKVFSSANDLDLGGSLEDKKEEVWKLLSQVDKPTIAELLALLGGVPKPGEKNPFHEYGRTFNLSREIEEVVPRLASQFEYAFPNAIWYGLGRDIYLFSDILDAFYTYLGQPGKVRRLHASQPSFDEKNIEEVVGFLKTNGFDFENIGPDSRPQIFFDITSYSHGSRYSQSSQLMRAAYHEWVRLGRDPRELLSKVNFVSTGKGSYEMPLIEPNFSLEKFFKNVKMMEYGPETIPLVENSSMLQYSEAWHELYEPFQTHADGSVTSAPGRPSGTALKLKLLWEMWEIVNTVMNDDFVKTANRAGQKFNVKFERCENLLAGEK